MEEIKDLKVVTSKYVMETLQLLIEVFLQVLLEYHNLSAETIALMSGVSEKEVNDLVENPKVVSVESKYKISKTVMSLRFFLKELEP